MIFLISEQLLELHPEFLDSGYKYQYDRYNDVFRYVPLNGDIVGLWDFIERRWFSPGFTRGSEKCSETTFQSKTNTERFTLQKWYQSSSHIFW